MFGNCLHLFIFMNFINLFSYGHCKIPDVMLCADPKCTEPISEAEGKIMYPPSGKNVLGFSKGAKITIISKCNESKCYWGARIGILTGFVPSDYVREVKVFKGSDKLIYSVPTNITDGNIFELLKESEVKNEEDVKVEEGKPPETKDPIMNQPVPSLLNSTLNVEDVNNATNDSINDILNVDTPSSVPQERASEIPTNIPEDDADVEEEEDEDAEENEEDEEEGEEDDEEEGEEEERDEKEKGGGPLQGQTNENNYIQTHYDEKNKVQNDTIVNSLGNTHNESLGVVDNEVKAENVVNSSSFYLSQPSQQYQQSNETSASAPNYVQSKGSVGTESQPGTSETILNADKNYNKDMGSEEGNIKINVKEASSEAGDMTNMNTLYPSDGNHVKKSESNLVFDSVNTETNILSQIYRNSLSLSENENNLGNHQNKVMNSVEDNASSDILNNVNKENPEIVSVPDNKEEKSAGTLAFGNLASEGIQIEIESSSSGAVSDAHENSNASDFGVGEEMQHDADMKNDAGITSNNEIVFEDGMLAEENLLSESTLVSNGNSNAFKGDDTLSVINDSYNSGSINSDSSVSGSASTGSHIAGDINVGIGVASDGFSGGSHEKVEHPVEVQQGVDYSTVIPNSLGSSDPGPMPPIINYINAKGSQSNLVFDDQPSTQQNSPSSLPEDNSPNKEVISEGAGNIEGTTHSGIALTESSTNSYGDDLDKEVVEEKKPTEPPTVVQESTQNSEVVTEEPTSQNPEESVIENSDDGFFSKFGEFVSGWLGFGSESAAQEIDVDVNINPSEIDEKVLYDNSAPSESQIEKVDDGQGGVCKGGSDSDVNCEVSPSNEYKDQIWNLWSSTHPNSDLSSSNTVIYLIVTAVTVLIFTLGYYFIEKSRSDGPLIAKVNSLEQELLVSSKECLILKDELMSTKEKLNLFETSSDDKIITALQLELEESKKIRSELESNIEALQQELDTATEAGLDLNRMLSEVLMQKDGSQTLMESVESLQSELNNQQMIIHETTSKLVAKTKENVELRDELAAAYEKIEGLEGELEDMRGNLNVHLKDNEDIINDLTSRNSELQRKIAQLNEMKEKENLRLRKNVDELEKKLKAAADCLVIKEEECNNLKDSVKQIKMKGSKSLDSLFDVSRVKAELVQSENEKDSLKERIKDREDKMEKLSNRVKNMEEEMEKLKRTSAEAEKEKVEAQTKLEVLSNYFKEKETQLQKELGLREAMWVQKQGDDSTLYEKMKSLEEEISNYKSQNEALKKEIIDQERGLKAQITSLEKKAHENWIAARQAERKLEETRQEAGQLRNKLTLVEKSMSNDLEQSQLQRGNEDLNGGDTLSPLMHDTASPILFPLPLPMDPNNASMMPPGFIPPPMFMPPPPTGFMPPPPPFLPGDHRPPPLGRMSSPPLNNRFSPPPSDYAYDRMSTPPLSPTNRNLRSPSESDRDHDRFRHRTPVSPFQPTSYHSRNWEESPSSVGMSGFRPISNKRDSSRRDTKGGSNLSSGHSSDSLDKSSRTSGRV